MTLVALLHALAGRDVRLSVDGAKLRVDAPQRALTPELRDELGAQKPALIQWVGGCRDDAILLDFETRAAVDLEEAGARTYLAHPSFEVLCLAAMNADRSVIVWTHGHPPPAALLDAAAAGVPLVAHNAARFNRLVWVSLGWPRALGSTPSRWREWRACPVELNLLACNLLGRHKDIEGQKLTIALGRPNRDGQLPVVTDEMLARVAAYCRDDVEILADLWFLHLRRFRDVEMHVRALDEAIDERRLPVRHRTGLRP